VAGGTIQLTTRNGATLTGFGGGTIIPAGPVALHDFTFTATEGTRRFQHVAGTIALDGAWNFTDPPGNAISGTLTGSLQR
jgi:hypothetical protein